MQDVPAVEIETTIKATPKIEASAEIGVDKLLGIVKKRLERITQPPQGENSTQPESKEKQEQRNTAQALLNILNGSEIQTASLTTTIKPKEDQPSQGETPQESTPATSESSVSEDESPKSAEEPQLITYQNVRINYENGTITATDPNGQEVSFSLSQIAIDMAQTLNLPPHQVELIRAHLSGKQINLAETARSFGFLTRDEIFEIFRIPLTPDKRAEALQNPNLPQWQKKLIAGIDALPQVPDAQQIIQVFSLAEIPTDKPLTEVINTIQKYAEKLPPEQKAAYEQLIIQAQQQLEQLGEESVTLAQTIESHYQKLETGENINPQETLQTIETLLNIESVGKNLSQEKRKEILNKALEKWGKGGIIIILLLTFLILRSSQELTGSRQQ